MDSPVPRTPMPSPLLPVALALVAPATADPTSSSFAIPAPAEESLSWWTDNLRWTVDVSARHVHRPSESNNDGLLFVGLDLHNVFSSSRGDIGTLVLQAYLSGFDGAEMRPVFVEEENDWELVFRIFNFNYTQLFRRRLNVRVGHFEIPFGLEHHVNTNGTLRQYLHGPNLGVKADWGVTLNGEASGLEYELAWSRGTGNEWSDRGSPGIVSGRVGTDRDATSVFGLSAFVGDVLTPGGIVERERYGVDAMTLLGPFNLMGELAYGSDFSQDVVNGLAEVNWRDPEESILVFLQVRDLLRKVGTHWQDRASSSLGFRYAPDNHWAISAQWTQELTAPVDKTRDGAIALQLRYRL